MLEFAIKYWIEFLFTLIVTGGTFVVKRYMSLIKKERQQKEDEFYKKLQNEIISSLNKTEATDKLLEKEINEVSDSLLTLKRGLLSVQGKEFRRYCRKLLEEDHEITLREFEQVSKDHEAYNSLGGNHEGDRLYDLVKKKAENTLTDIQ